MLIYVAFLEAEVGTLGKSFHILYTLVGNYSN